MTRLASRQVYQRARWNAWKALGAMDRHEAKTETLMLWSGEAVFSVDNAHYEWEAGQSYHLRPGTQHRIRAVTECVFMEVSTPELDDVVRLADDYGRT